MDLNNEHRQLFGINAIDQSDLITSSIAQLLNKLFNRSANCLIGNVIVNHNHLMEQSSQKSPNHQGVFLFYTTNQSNSIQSTSNHFHKPIQLIDKILIFLQNQVHPIQIVNNYNFITD